MIYECRKRAYTAQAICVCFGTDNNLEELAAFAHEVKFSWVGDYRGLLARYGTAVHGVKNGDYFVRGENNQLKYYSAEQFHIKYEVTRPAALSTSPFSIPGWEGDDAAY